MNTKILSLIIVMFFVSGCATKNNRDPLENYNRVVFKFNQVVYDYALIPAAKSYRYIMPNKFQNGVNNFYNNILEPGRIMNDILQLNFKFFIRDTVRFIFNSIFGVFGLFDVAKEIGLDRRTQNFGFTLAYWGYRYSAYFVLPILGPNTFGGSLGGLVDIIFNPLNYTIVTQPYVSWGAYAVYEFNEGSSYLPIYEKVTKDALDPYVAVRNAYIQNYDYDLDKVLKFEANVDSNYNSAYSKAEVMNILNSQ